MMRCCGNGIHEQGAAFLQKPFSLDTLARKVRDTLGQTDEMETTDRHLVSGEAEKPASSRGPATLPVSDTAMYDV